MAFDDGIRDDMVPEDGVAAGPPGGWGPAPGRNRMLWAPLRFKGQVSQKDIAAYIIARLKEWLWPKGEWMELGRRATSVAAQLDPELAQVLDEYIKDLLDTGLELVGAEPEEIEAEGGGGFGTEGEGLIDVDEDIDLPSMTPSDAIRPPVGRGENVVVAGKQQSGQPYIPENTNALTPRGTGAHLTDADGEPIAPSADPDAIDALLPDIPVSDPDQNMPSVSRTVGLETLTVVGETKRGFIVRMPDPTTKLGYRYEGIKDVVFPPDRRISHKDGKMIDANAHFPIDTPERARVAMGRVNQYRKLPRWARRRGIKSLQGLRERVFEAVRKKYPDMEIEAEPGKPRTKSKSKSKKSRPKSKKGKK